MSNYTNPARTIELLESLQEKGLKDSQFSVIHHFTTDKIEKHKDYCRTVENFHTDGNNQKVQERLEWLDQQPEKVIRNIGFDQLTEIAIKAFP